MLFSLQKTLGLLLMPCGLLWLLFIAATLWTWRRKQRGPALFLTVTTLLFTLLGNIHVCALFIRPLERKVSPCDLNLAGPFDAVFVLGGGTELDPSGQPRLGAAGDRVTTAAQLWHAGRTKMLVASGIGKDGLQGVRDLGLETRRIWVSLGVPSQAIHVIEKPCLNTREEITEYARLCQAQSFKNKAWQHIALVSSASHLPRALELASRLQLNTNRKLTPIGSDYLGRERAFQFQDIVPQERGFRVSQTALWEWLGRFKG